MCDLIRVGLKEGDSGRDTGQGNLTRLPSQVVVKRKRRLMDEEGKSGIVGWC